MKLSNGEADRRSPHQRSPGRLRHLIFIADLSDQAGWRYVEFFTANIRYPHTRHAYPRVCSQFFVSCDQCGLTLTAIWLHDVALDIEKLHDI
jgi:hypothetical protein